jgi:hypothetical protein
VATSSIWTTVWRTRATWIAFLAIAFPLLRLWPLDGQFFIDWPNHKWLAAYPGEYFAHHGWFPVSLNTTEESGLPYPIFYGALLYPLCGLLTSWLSPDIVLRIVIIGVTWLAYRSVSRALLRYEVAPWLARGVACLTIWATYPLTNLYHRAALAEYIATTLLTAICASWFLLVRCEDATERRRLGLVIGLLFTLCAGTHPITALYSLPVLLLLAVAAYSEHGRDRAFWIGVVRALAIPVVLTIVALSPWLYGLAKFQSKLKISTDAIGTGVLFNENDTLASRFWPIPHDLRDPHAVNAPYLETQLNVALLILIVGWLVLFARRGKTSAIAGARATVLYLAVFVLFVWLSLSPTAYDHLPAIAKMLQIAYRAVTYQNLALLLAVFCLVALARRRGEKQLLDGGPIAMAIMGVCVVLAGTGAVIKQLHASDTMNHNGTRSAVSSATERASWTHLPRIFYGDDSYVITSAYQPLPATGGKVGMARFPVGSGSDFGDLLPVKVNLPEDAWIATSAQPFPWNHIVLDGTEVPADQLFVIQKYLALRAPAGAHTLELRVEPDSAWSVLRVVSFLLTVLWAIGLAFLSIRARKRGMLRRHAA